MATKKKKSKAKEDECEDKITINEGIGFYHDVPSESEYTRPKNWKPDFDTDIDFMD